MLVLLVRDGADNDADSCEDASTHDQTRAKLGEGSLRRIEHQLRQTDRQTRNMI